MGSHFSGRPPQIEGVRLIDAEFRSQGRGTNIVEVFRTTSVRRGEGSHPKRTFRPTPALRPQGTCQSLGGG
jgi:hypothetical protein